MHEPSRLPDIRALTRADQLRAVWPVVEQLRPHLDQRGFIEQAVRQASDGFRMTSLYVDGVPRAFAGWRVLEMLHTGRQLYVDDLVTDVACRSTGHGRQLLDWLKDEARQLGCARLQLDSGTQRQDAHAFYLREGLRIEAFHFGITL